MLKKCLLFTIPGLLLCIPAPAQYPTGAAAFAPEKPETEVVVYFDFACTTCRDMWPDLRRLTETYSGRATFLFRPIDSMGNVGSLQAGIASLYAHQRNQFWKTADALFASSSLDRQGALEAGKAAGLEPQGMSQALSNPSLMDAVGANKQDFDQAGYYLTPTIVLDGEPYEGRQGYEELEHALRAAMGEATSQEAPASAEPRWSQLIYPAPKAAPQVTQPALGPGDKAPNFTLPTVSGDKVSLADYRGKKNVLLTFVPAAFTPVCSGQWPRYADRKAEFDQLDTAVLGITTDNIPTLHAWTKGMAHLNFPVLSDFWPHGETARKYGVLREDSGETERATFLIDKKGVVRHVEVHDFNAMPDIEATMTALKAMRE